MRDLLPAEMAAFRRAEDAFRSAATRWGYREVRTPTIEPYSLFTLAGTLTPQMLSRVYSFLDWDGWSGERVVLRPDSTIPVVRAAEAARLALPARLFYVQNRFRYSQDGEDSELWQGGLEHLGAPPVLGDVEAIAVGCETLESLGLEPEVRLAHVGVPRAFVGAVAGADLARRQELLDQAAEEGLAGLVACLPPELAPLAALGLERGEGAAFVTNLMALLGGALPGVTTALEELRAVAEAVTSTGRGVVVDLGMPCDFEYYDGVVFEFVARGRVWGRGGRYVPPFGRCETACGLGLELSELAAALGADAVGEPAPAVVARSPRELPKALDVLRRLHAAGLNATLERELVEGRVRVVVDDGTLTVESGAGVTTVGSFEQLITVLAELK